MPAKHNPKNRRRLFVAQGGKCYWCGQPCRMWTNMHNNHADHFTVDHVIPKKNGGPVKRRENLVGACYACNQLRNALDHRRDIGRSYDATYISRTKLGRHLVEERYERLIQSVDDPLNVEPL